MTDIHAGSLVTRKGGDGSETLVTYVTGDNAQCQWWTADGDLISQMIPVADLEVVVPEAKRARFVNDMGQAHEEIVTADFNDSYETWKAEQLAILEAEKANEAAIATANEATALATALEAQA
jgi:hypothetical protein